MIPRETFITRESYILTSHSPTQTDGWPLLFQNISGDHFEQMIWLFETNVLRSPSPTPAASWATQEHLWEESRTRRFWQSAL